MSTSSQPKQKVVLIAGDGIGPEIGSSVKDIFAAAGANVAFVDAQLGKIRDASGKVIDASTAEGKAAINAEITKTAEFVREHKVVLKGPTATPKGGGPKSMNVSIRKGTGQFANRRSSYFGDHELVIYRENEEGLYAAVEHQQTQDVLQALSIKSKSGMHRIIQAAFEDALLQSRTKVTCMAKDNILKMTEGGFVATFNEIAKRYPTYKLDKDGKTRIPVGNLEGVPKDQHIQITEDIIDIGMARVAKRPQDYQVVVTENLFGDIMTDVASEMSGSVGIGASSNIGTDYAMFEAIHGTADDIAGQDKANPSGLLMASVEMLEYLGGEQNLKAATTIRDAWLWTLSDGIMTGDLSISYKCNSTIRTVGTDAFNQAIIARVNRIQQGEQAELKEPWSHQRVDYVSKAQRKAELAAKQDGLFSFRETIQRVRPYRAPKTSTTTQGADFFIEWNGLDDSTLSRYKAKTGVDLAQTFNLSEFGSIQELYDTALWFKKAVDEAVMNGHGAMPFSQCDAMKNWGVDKLASLIPSAADRPLSELKQVLDEVAGHHQTMVMATSQSLASKLQSLSKDSPLELEMISNRGQSVWPETIDPIIVDHMRCRFKLRKPEEGKNEQAARRHIVALKAALVDGRLNITHEEQLRTYQQVGDKAPKDGFGSAYGQGWGTRVMETMGVAALAG